MTEITGTFEVSVIYTSKLMKKTCSKCLAIFDCNVENIHECQCTTIQLTDKQKALLQTTYLDCLCFNCLKDIQEHTNSHINQHANTEHENEN